MKILLLAKNGQVGWELNRSLLPLGNIFAYDKLQANLEEPNMFVRLIREIKPDVIVNPAAYTAVDLAETEKRRAYQINTAAPGILAEEARRIGAILIHYSTDYVFDGMKTSPYVENDVPNPLNEYGRTKLLGEQAIQSEAGAYLILRTSWVYSMREMGGFVNKVLQWSRKQKELRIVTDQIGSPTWARVLAETTALVLSKGSNYLDERRGLYHLAGNGFASRYELAQMILEMDTNREEQIVSSLLPALTSDFPLPAARPAYSPLDCSKFENTFQLLLPHWKNSLQIALEQG